MQNTEFTDSNQTIILYIQDLLQLIYLSLIQSQITQERIKTQQRVDYLIFLRF